MLDDATFGDLLASLVRRQGLTMADFARKVKVSASTLSRIRTGTRQPNAKQLARWADALRLDAEHRRQFIDLALLAQTPAEIRERLASTEAQAVQARDQHQQLAQDYGRYRTDQGFHDGWWLTYSSSFLNDGRIQRSLIRISGDQSSMQVRDAGRLHYSYHGSCESLGDKLFIRLAEDRGGAEYVQITLHSLFDYQRPSFLYGLVCGISGKDVRHPMSVPAASRILFLYAGSDRDLPDGCDQRAKLESVLGSFDPKAVRHVWPTFLGDGEYLRDCLRLGDEALDAAVLRMIDSRGPNGDQVLRAAFG
jgi:transcriptional regulator with XRE-family HTH domain